MTTSIQFTNGATYERYMGRWSQLAGERFLDWLAPAPGLRWLDVGCGNGAFTELLASRCTPRSLHGIDPSAEQLAHAQGRPALQEAIFDRGDAMALPYAAEAFDAAVMPLVIFFLIDPARGVAEMRRVVAPGGWVSAYGWDLPGGGFPYALLQGLMREQGLDVPGPPSPEAGRADVMQALWAQAGLVDVTTCEIVVQRTWDHFDDYWQTVLGAPSVGSQLAALQPQAQQALQQALRERLVADSAGRITCQARANAVKGRVPAR